MRLESHWDRFTGQRVVRVTGTQTRAFVRIVRLAWGACVTSLGKAFALPCDA